MPPHSQRAEETSTTDADPALDVWHTRESRQNGFAYLANYATKVSHHIVDLAAGIGPARLLSQANGETIHRELEKVAVCTTADFSPAVRPSLPQVLAKREQQLNNNRVPSNRQAAPQPVRAAMPPSQQRIRQASRSPTRTVAQLKEDCRSNGLPVSGTKPVLRERLEQARNILVLSDKTIQNLDSLFAALTATGTRQAEWNAQLGNLIARKQDWRHGSTIFAIGLLEYALETVNN